MKNISSERQTITYQQLNEMKQTHCLNRDPFFVSRVKTNKGKSQL